MSSKDTETRLCMRMVFVSCRSCGNATRLVQEAASHMEAKLVAMRFDCRLLISVNCHTHIITLRKEILVVM
jgi:hypothetical protein